ncbi:nucleotidyltransferase domain-containing protein [Paenibacillus lignilyticus]|uniref:Nucleotidyltransferase domain-containing protein n=1 Tax=Paenibacillus lignilyticus TaxID=1172615 RepID=A0ABS5CK67_9BACL|nr:nucleotidyltransferase domain-containing protein [Paenibacillus lignilyticus]MBP3966219.1 nucleotidyltransferase domain-containing protein [Paenibacillus lignilyticus]
MEHIHSIIKNELARLEQEEQVIILYACESGSRAWGFPSQDSDYDVRFIYIRRPEWYLSIFDKRDVIERPISDMLDISGWDIRKALNLYRKSNPPLLEWLQSPIQYAEKLSLAEQLRQLSPLAFSPKSCMYHYLNMARGNYRMYLQGERVRIKKYFYVLRPVLACEWIERYGEMPPMEFEVLAEHLVPRDGELWETIQQLLYRKKAGEELVYEPRLHAINAYLEERLQHFEQTAVVLTKEESQLGEQLDALFRSTLQEAWQ